MRVYILALLVAVAAEAAPQHGGGGGDGHHFEHRGPHHLLCGDGVTKATCTCATEPCGPGKNTPDCTCADGTVPKMKAPCNDGTWPYCPGACSDGSDPITPVWPTAIKPCPVGFPDFTKCTCADGTVLPKSKPKNK